MQETMSLSRSVETNAVLRNTYLLLSMTMVCTAITAYFGTLVHFSAVGYIGTVIAGFIALFMIFAFRNSGWGVLFVFAFTGLEGFSLGPMLQHYLALPNGSMLVTMAAGITALLFASLSGYVLISRKNFNFMGGLLFISLLALVLVSLVAMFIPVPGLHLALAYFAVILFSGYVLYDTSEIIHGGERNYIIATVQLYLDILNIFVNMLRILRD